MLVLRTFPELVGRSVQNLVEIGPAVRACKGDIGTNIHFIGEGNSLTKKSKVPN